MQCMLPFFIRMIFSQRTLNYSYNVGAGDAADIFKWGYYALRVGDGSFFLGLMAKN